MNPDPPAAEDPARLVRLFQQAERNTRRATGDLLTIACQLLHLATTGLVASRGCARVTFEFEGYRTHAVVTLVAVTPTGGASSPSTCSTNGSPTANTAGTRRQSVSRAAAIARPLVEARNNDPLRLSR